MQEQRRHEMTKGDHSWSGTRHKAGPTAGTYEREVSELTKRLRTYPAQHISGEESGESQRKGGEHEDLSRTTMDVIGRTPVNGYTDDAVFQTEPSRSTVLHEEAVWYMRQVIDRGKQKEEHRTSVRKSHKAFLMHEAGQCSSSCQNFEAPPPVPSC